MSKLHKATGSKKPQQFTYAWQQLVDDCLRSSGDLRWKINAAEHALSARLIDIDSPDLLEHTALKEALRIIRALLSERKQPREIRKIRA